MASTNRSLVPILAGVVLAVAVNVGTASTAAAAFPPPGICLNEAIVSRAYGDNNLRFVSAELGWAGDQYGILRARPNQTSVGPWERFQICEYNHMSFYSIKSLANNLMVAAEVNRSGDAYAVLRARTLPANAAGWEQFNFTRTLVPPSSHILSLQNGLFTAAEVGWSGDQQGILRARTSPNSLGQWEKFETQNA